MGEFSMSHIIVVGVLVLILFGSQKLPEFGKSLGKSIKSFKDGLNEIDAESKNVKHDQITQQKDDQTSKDKS